MVYALKDLLLEVTQDNGPLEDFATVWRAIMRCAEDVLHSGRGISIPNFARITIIKNSIREGPGLKGKVFLLSETFQRNHSALFKKPGLGLLAPCIDFNFAKLCVLTQLDKDAAQQMMAALFTTLGKAISKGQSVRVTFGRIGVLVAEDHRVHFTFFSDDNETASNQRNAQPAGTKSVPKLVMDEAKKRTSARRAQTAGTDRRAPEQANGPRKASQQQSHRPSATSGPPPPRQSRSNSSQPQTTVGEVSQFSSPSPAHYDEESQQQQRAPPPPASCLSPPFTPISTTTTGRCFSEFGSPDVRHLSNGVDVDLNIKPTSIFPSFRNLGPAAANKALKDSAAHHRTLEIAYHRLEERISKEKEAENRQRESIKQRLESIEAKQQHDNAEKRRKQAEWRAYLMKQAEDLKKRRDDEHTQLFAAPAPGLVKAYPQVGQYDRSKKSEREKQIRETLDEQVKAKEVHKQHLKQQELNQDQLLIDWVKLTDQQERNNKLAKKILERESLFREWDMQRQHLKDVKAMGPAKIL